MFNAGNNEGNEIGGRRERERERERERAEDESKGIEFTRCDARM